MSMLTPPGMGGKYRITGNSYPRMRRPRRRRRIVAATVAATAALGVLSWGTVQLYDTFVGDDASARIAADGRNCEPGTGGKDGGGASARPAEDSRRTASRTPGALPKPSAVTVNVYNATTRAGLAKKTAETLEKRGFRIGEVANAPASLDKKVKEAGLLMGPPSTYRTGAFDVLRTHFPEADIRPVERNAPSRPSASPGADKPAEGTVVDLVIGNGFDGLAAEKAARKAMAALATPSPSPSPSIC
ncbi:LytR family transcriptional regulator [Streptomyces sp. TRM43335]|uniref:LytR family transcriptional regulator n=1 Tax=Streptomyces taklimakanensis TaxID=2569853 RepID=A0A6G2BDG2_9ACTN|nr:LytR C-terminal domain-containing protein [Streptomyces taklimakanensis]MTE20119.1 LytR family transcriptional regulator [Streptomyces taklimakanensis]